MFGKNNLVDIVDSQVLYTGADILCCNIKKGEYYNEVTVKLANTLCTWIEQNIDVSCLLEGTCGNCDPLVKIPDAIKVIVNTLCNLTTDKVYFQEDLNCLLSGGDGSKLIGKSLKYSVNSAGSKSNIELDLNNVKSNLPLGYQVGDINTKIWGTPKNGRSILVDTDKSAISLSVDYDRYPIKLESKVRYNTPNGTVDLTHKSVIDTPVDNSSIYNDDIQDLTSKNSTTLTEVINIIGSELCTAIAELSNLKNIQISGCENITYNTTDIKGIVGIHSSVLCDHEEKLTNLEKTVIKDCSDDCGERTISLDLQAAILKLSEEICSLKKEIKELKLKTSNTTNSSSSSSSPSTAGGGCFGGSCT